jgi:hypothetical protein
MGALVLLAADSSGVWAIQPDKTKQAMAQEIWRDVMAGQLELCPLST